VLLTLVYVGATIWLVWLSQFLEKSFGISRLAGTGEMTSLGKL